MQSMIVDALACFSQKTLPVMVAVVEQLGGALGESGLLVVPCVAAHLNQVLLTSIHLYLLKISLTDKWFYWCRLLLTRFLLTSGFGRTSRLTVQRYLEYWKCGSCVQRYLEYRKDLSTSRQYNAQRAFSLLWWQVNSQLFTSSKGFSSTWLCSEMSLSLVATCQSGRERESFEMYLVKVITSNDYYGQRAKLFRATLNSLSFQASTWM